METLTEDVTRADSPVRVMFVAWGDSIHARRRIQLFADDPAFDVAVAATFDFSFANCRNYLLESARPEKPDVVAEPSWRRYVKLFSRIVLIRLLYGVLSILGKKISIHELYSAFNDLQELKAAAKEFKPDVIFLQTLLYPCYLSYALPRKLPLMITFWNGDVTWWSKSTGIERFFKKELVVYGVRRARKVTVNSEAALSACLGYGANNNRLHLIRYPGVDLSRFKPGTKEESRRLLGISAGKVVLAPRGLGGYLNSEIIVKAISLLAVKIPDLLVVFVSGAGGESELERHRQLADSLGITEHCRWEGHVSWEMMPDYYNASDVMISISDKDSLPNCMLEAMACGVPVVMGDIPPIREWIKDGVNGALVRTQDPEALCRAVLSVFANQDGASDRFVARNLDLVGREFDMKKNAKIIKNLVRHVAEVERQEFCTVRGYRE